MLSNPHTILAWGKEVFPHFTDEETNSEVLCNLEGCRTQMWPVPILSWIGMVLNSVLFYFVLTI